MRQQHRDPAVLVGMKLARLALDFIQLDEELPRPLAPVPHPGAAGRLPLPNLAGGMAWAADTLPARIDAARRTRSSQPRSISLTDTRRTVPACCAGAQPCLDIKAATTFRTALRQIAPACHAPRARAGLAPPRCVFGVRCRCSSLPAGRFAPSVACLASARSLSSSASPSPPCRTHCSAVAAAAALLQLPAAKRFYPQ
jgi:hypothetical protein